ncbi:hypothetical protein BU23DRAFT_637975 [Bimuria novae-zelandiae CBS 107.79]|uniref:Uncharacterized protein n=1 Tax=Bimuria novae-zelandiae CBS 107.79 TaxID=1447943 RepID=A0A6A5VCG0_9PLEO|nr:hypothetical protein BU23DRAFT_637975 [Bimuria novae-zelandiae CBS 107.79]
MAIELVIFLRKDFAKDHKIWLYVNPDTPKENIPDLEAANPKPQLTNYKARASKLSDLSPEDQITQQKQERALDLPTIYNRLVALKKQFCPYRPQEDFLIACQAHHPNYAATCLDQVYEHEMNGTNPPSLPTYVEKITKYTRRAASTAEVGTLSTSVAELGIAKPCICGLSHALHDCYILNLNYPSQPKDWTLLPIRVAKRINNALKSSY